MAEWGSCPASLFHPGGGSNSPAPAAFCFSKQTLVPILVPYHQAQPDISTWEGVSHYCCGYYGRAFGAGSAQLSLTAKPYWTLFFWKVPNQTGRKMGLRRRVKFVWLWVWRELEAELGLVSAASQLLAQAAQSMFQSVHTLPTHSLTSSPVWFQTDGPRIQDGWGLRAGWILSECRWQEPGWV